MANYNTIASAPQAAALGNATSETAFGLITGSTVRTLLPAPNLPSGNLDGRSLLLRAGILVTTGGAFTYTSSIRLHSGGQTSQTVFTNDTAIATTTTLSISTATRMVTQQALLTWDVTTARLAGSMCFAVDNTFTTWAALTAGLTSGVASVSTLTWLITGLFSSTSGSNTAILKYFEMDVV